MDAATGATQPLAKVGINTLQAGGGGVAEALGLPAVPGGSPPPPAGAELKPFSNLMPAPPEENATAVPEVLVPQSMAGRRSLCLSRYEQQQVVFGRGGGRPFF